MRYLKKECRGIEIDAGKIKFLFGTYAAFQNLPSSPKNLAWKVARIFSLWIFEWKINEIYGVEKVFEKRDSVIYENRMAD